MGATTVQHNGRRGIAAISGHVTVLNTTLSRNGHHGIEVANSGSGRIGIRDDQTAYAGNTIVNNGGHGLHISDGAGASIGGNTIHGNGTNPTLGWSFGVNILGASAVLVGNNSVQGNAGTGVFVSRGGNATIGSPGWGLPIANTISANGFTAADKGGIGAYRGAVIDVRDATISGNHGAGVQAHQDSIILLRASTVSSNVFASSGFNGGHGILAGLRSTVRLRDGSAVQNNAGDGVQISDGSAVDFRFGVVSTVTGNGGYGLQCLDGEASYSGVTSGIGSNTLGAISPTCTGF